MFYVRIQELAATVADLGDDAHIDAIRALEDLKSACAAAQARITAELDATRTNPAGLGAEIALARRESPNRGGRHLGFARAMQEMPHTLALLESGELNEWRATLLVRETACLTKEDRGVIDQEFCADPSVLAGLGDRAIETKARARAAQLDAEAVVRRARKAVADRHVSIRPAPDTMAHVTALLPVAEGVAVWANLKRDADSLVGTGQAGDRTRGQVMADLLVERITSIDNADAQPFTVNVVISDETLFGDDSTPAHVDGSGSGGAVGPSPRRARRGAVWTQRSAASASELAERRKTAPKSAATPPSRSEGSRTQCDAPIRHHDHIEEHENGGETTELNGAGLCAACNYAKQSDGWRAQSEPADGLHRYSFTTPTGHTYRSTAPPLPLPAKKRVRTRQFEIDIVWAA